MARVNTYKFDVPESLLKNTTPTDGINLWKEDVQEIVYQDKTVYKPSYTYDNCWRKYGLVDANGYINTAGQWRNYKFPFITDLKKALEENKCSLAHSIPQSVDRDAIVKELYRILPEVNWYKYSAYREWNFLGHPWFTHAWDAKGVNLGGIGWGEPNWIFNLRPDDRMVHDWNDDRGNPLYDFSFTYFLAGSNLMQPKFRFGENCRISNAQGLFKASQVHVLADIQDLEGNKLVSTKNRGFSPFVMVEMFKQTAENNIKGDGDWIYWDNCHSAGQLAYDNWHIKKIASFNNVGLGADVDGNRFVMGYPDRDGIHPFFNRQNRSFLGGSASLEEFGPLLDMKYMHPSQAQQLLPSSMKRIRIRNLNNGNWDFSHCVNLDWDSWQFILRNLWDLRKYEAYTEDNKREVLNRTNTYVPNAEVIGPDNTTFIDNVKAAYSIANLKGWSFYVMRGGAKKEVNESGVIE